MKKIKPLNDRILVRRSKTQTTKSGILLPETAKEKPKEGEVIATGPGKSDEEGKLQPTTLKVGDRVLFTSYAGTEVNTEEKEEEELLIMSEDDVLAVLR